MPATVYEFNDYTKLRGKAEAHLQAGTTPATGNGAMSVDTLRLLHRLSSNPDSAQDALKLLHELQVHQVELDLQNEEIAAIEQVLVEDLDLYRTLFDAAPVGYFLVDFEGEVIQGNFVAAEFLGVGRDELEGHPIDTFLVVQSRPQLLSLLKRVAQSGVRDSCVAETGGRAQGSRRLRFLASIPPGCGYILLACSECAMQGTPISQSTPWLP